MMMSLVLTTAWPLDVAVTLRSHTQEHEELEDHRHRSTQTHCLEQPLECTSTVPHHVSCACSPYMPLRAHPKQLQRWCSARQVMFVATVILEAQPKPNRRFPASQTVACHIARSNRVPLRTPLMRNDMARVAPRGPSKWHVRLHLRLIGTSKGMTYMSSLCLHISTVGSRAVPKELSPEAMVYLWWPANQNALGLCSHRCEATCTSHAGSVHSGYTPMRSVACTCVI